MQGQQQSASLNVSKTFISGGPPQFHHWLPPIDFLFLALFLVLFLTQHSAPVSDVLLHMMLYTLMQWMAVWFLGGR